MNLHKHIKRLNNYIEDSPIFFITTCTHQRKPILSTQIIASILVDEWEHAREKHGWIVGRFVIMPDHVHFFCVKDIDEDSSVRNRSLSQFMQQWKQWTSKRVLSAISNHHPHNINKMEKPHHIWQAGFFDHVLRSSESYNEKWKYVVSNPVRKGLVKTASEWPFQGEIFDIYL